MAILLCKVHDSSAPDSPGKWRAGAVVEVFDDGHLFGAAEIPEAGNFYHVTVTDKTREEALSYIQAWNHEPVINQIQANGDARLIEVTSSMVSASGGNAFTRAGVEGLLSALNSKHPGCSATYQTHDNTSFRFSITADVGLRDSVVAAIDEAVRDMQYSRRRWYITAAARDFLATNGGVVSGTAAQVSAYLRDGLLD